MHAICVKMPTEPGERTEFPGTRAVSSCEPPGTRARNKTVVLCKNHKHCNS